MEREFYASSVYVKELEKLLEKMRAKTVRAERNCYYKYREGIPGNLITVGTSLHDSFPIIEESGSVIITRCTERGEPLLDRNGVCEVKQLKKPEMEAHYQIVNNDIIRENSQRMIMMQLEHDMLVRKEKEMISAHKGDWLAISDNKEYQIVTNEDFENNYYVIEEYEYEQTPSYMQEYGYEIAEERKMTESVEEKSVNIDYNEERETR